MSELPELDNSDMPEIHCIKIDKCPEIEKDRIEIISRIAKTSSGGVYKVSFDGEIIASKNLQFDNLDDKNPNIKREINLG